MKREADMRDAAIEKYNVEQEAAKVTKRKLQHQTKTFKEQEGEKRAAREAAKVMRDQAKAKERVVIDAREAERAGQKKLATLKKVIQFVRTKSDTTIRPSVDWHKYLLNTIT